MGVNVTAYIIERIMTETKFAYRNKRNGKWLKIGIEEYNRSEKTYTYTFREGEYESLTDSSLYSARNLIEEDFSFLRIGNKSDYELIEIEVTYNIKRNLFSELKEGIEALKDKQHE